MCLFLMKNGQLTNLLFSQHLINLVLKIIFSTDILSLHNKRRNSHIIKITIDPISLDKINNTSLFDSIIEDMHICMFGN